MDEIYVHRSTAGIFDVEMKWKMSVSLAVIWNLYYKDVTGLAFMMVDTYFEGQRRAAIRTQEAGLTIVRMTVRKPVAIETDPNLYEKLYMEDSQLENINDTALIISNEFNTHTQINLRNVDCCGVKRIAKYRESGRSSKVRISSTD